MYVLHGNSDSASVIVRLLLEEAGIAYRFAEIDRKAGALTSAAYLAMNPTGLVPVMETPHGPVSETAAILLWLADTHALGPAPGAAERGVFLKWLFYLSNTPHAELMQLFYPARYCPPEGQAGHAALISGRFLAAFANLDRAAVAHPALFRAGGPLACYVLVLARWTAFTLPGKPRWFDLAAFPALAVLAAEAEGLASTARVAAAEGLGARPFTAPD